MGHVGSLFISYARDDSEMVSKLAYDLKRQGIDIWFDQIDVPAGVAWDLAIEAALTRARGVIGVLSPASVTSRNVRDELRQALDTRPRSNASS